MNDKRIGLARLVPSLRLCEKMVEISVLAEAFKDSALIWLGDKQRVIEEREHFCADIGIHAPTAQEMLEWLRGTTYDSGMPLVQDDWAVWPPVRGDSDKLVADITDPDALAEACIVTAKGDK